MQNNQIKCSNCKSQNIKKNGSRKTENRGLIQRYKCKECDYRFTINDGFFRMRNNPQKITQSIDLFYRGASTRGVQGHLAMFYPHNASNVSIYSWIVKYSKMISKFTNNLKLKVGQEAQIDEIEYHRRKSHKKGSRGTEKNFFIDSIDPKTKFMLSSEYMRTRSSRDIKTVMSRIKERTQKIDGEQQIKIITSDGWRAYKKIIKSIWGYNNKTRKHNIFHNRVIVSDEQGNFNYPIERLHNNARARTKVMRGFHGSISSANSIMKGFEIYYNFINKHQAINKCPYELAIPELAENLKDVKNRWLGLIYMSKN